MTKTGQTALSKTAQGPFVLQPFTLSPGFDLSLPTDQQTFMKSVQDYINQLNRRINSLVGVAGTVTLKVTDTSRNARVATFVNGILTDLE